MKLTDKLTVPLAEAIAVLSTKTIAQEYETYRFIQTQTPPKISAGIVWHILVATEKLLPEEQGGD